MVTDSEIILSALQRERGELHNRIMQVDRIISRIRSIDYSPDIVRADSPAASNEVTIYLLDHGLITDVKSVSGMILMKLFVPYYSPD